MRSCPSCGCIENHRSFGVYLHERRTHDFFRFHTIHIQAFANAPSKRVMVDNGARRSTLQEWRDS